jgi:hypothetical protein
MDRWKLEKRIEKIIDSNCKEIPWEGDEVDKTQLKYDLLNLIDEIQTDKLKEGIIELMRNRNENED